MKKNMKIKAPAKINIGLTITKRRLDGYHDLISVMEQISLSDVLLLEPQREGGWRYFCSEPSLSGKDNLVCRVASLLAERSKERELPGVKISLYKNIPAAAGLGGGSSDAAAALKGLNSFWNLEMSPEDLLEAAALIGSDVPYCLQGGTALVQGRGEKLEALPAFPFHWVVLAVPSGMHLSTAEVYAALKPVHLGQPRLHTLIAAIREQSAELLHEWFGGGMTNTLEAVVAPKHPRLPVLRRQFLDLGLYPVMSGSGPSFFALCENLSTAKAAAFALQEAGHRVFLSWTLSGLYNQKE